VAAVHRDGSIAGARQRLSAPPERAAAAEGRRHRQGGAGLRERLMLAGGRRRLKQDQPGGAAYEYLAAGGSPAVDEQVKCVDCGVAQQEVSFPLLMPRALSDGVRTPQSEIWLAPLDLAWGLDPLEVGFSLLWGCFRW
jgi:hypothetical protein